MSSLYDLRQANHAKLDDPVPGGVFRYQADTSSPLRISFYLAMDPPGVGALTYSETGGVIASLAKYMRRWRSNPPASAFVGLWKGEGTVLEQKAAGYISGLPNAADQ